MAGFNAENYVSVAERLGLFRAEHPSWGLTGEVLVDDGTRILFRAAVTDETGRVIGTGHAEEVRGKGAVNTTNPIENAETSAWGRALAALGYEVSRGIASREEMQGANQRASRPRQDRSSRPASPPDAPKPGAPLQALVRGIEEEAVARAVKAGFQERFGCAPLAITAEQFGDATAFLRDVFDAHGLRFPDMETGEVRA